MPQVSVVIPTFNQANFIARAIQSVLDQTLADWELIVVDDGSEDDTRAVIARYSDSRIHYVRQLNAGPSAARNHGVRRSTAAYVAMLDADDWWHPEFLSALVSALDNSPADVSAAHSDWCYSDASGTRLTPQGAKMTYGAELSTLVLRNPIAIHSAITRRSVLESLNGFTESDLLEDWDLWLRIAQAGGKFVHLPRVLASYYWHSGSRSKDPTRRISQRLATLDACWAREQPTSGVRPLEDRSYATAHIDACSSWLAIENVSAAADEFGAALARDPATALSLDAFYRLAHAQQSAFEGGQEGFESKMDVRVAGARIRELLEKARYRMDTALIQMAERSASFGLAVASYNQGDPATARALFLQGFFANWRVVPDRHILLVFAKSLLPMRTLNKLRAIKRWLKPQYQRAHARADASNLVVPVESTGASR